MLWSLVAIALVAGHPQRIAILGTWQTQQECEYERRRDRIAAAYVATYRAVLVCEPRG